MRRKLCTVNKCRKWKDLNENGVCPDHINSPNDQPEDVCKCSKCNNDVNENDAAINCDLCNKWFHRCCTDIKPDIYDLIDPEQEESPKGFQWYCDSCLPAITTLINNFRAKKDAGTHSVSTAVQFNCSKVPVCEDFRHGVCVHGMSGRKEVGEKKACSFRHPKECIKFCQFGMDPEFGCTDLECRFLHPVLCRYSLRSSYCDNEKCTYTHLKGTKRKHPTPNSLQAAVGARQGQQKKVGSRQNNQFSKYDPRSLGFRSYAQNKRLIREQERYPEQQRGNDCDFHYDESEFPHFNTIPTQQVDQKTNAHQSSEICKPTEDQTFLELLNIVKSIQQSQTSLENKFQEEIQALRRMIPPQIPPQIPSQFQNPQFSQILNQLHPQQNQFLNPQC